MNHRTITVAASFKVVVSLLLRVREGSHLIMALITLVLMMIDDCCGCVLYVGSARRTMRCERRRSASWTPITWRRRCARSTVAPVLAGGLDVSG